jgi:hypothetical protein
VSKDIKSLLNGPLGWCWWSSELLLKTLGMNKLDKKSREVREIPPVGELSLYGAKKQGFDLEQGNILLYDLDRQEDSFGLHMWR